MTPTQRTLAFLRTDLALQVGIVEKWNPHAKIRQDLYGFIDLVACSDRFGIIGVQATSGDHVAHRLTKIREEPKAAVWLASGGRIWVIGWRKVGPRGKRKVWEPRVVEVGKGFVEIDWTDSDLNTDGRPGLPERPSHTDSLG